MDVKKHYNIVAVIITGSSPKENLHFLSDAIITAADHHRHHSYL
jgi:hypothetical protein